LSSQPVRSYLVIAAAIVIAGVLISASVFVAVGGAKTTTTTLTSMTTVTITVTSTVISTPINSTEARVYAVTFQQVRYCGQYNIMPWAVTIGGLTQVQPPNHSLPLPTNTFSTIVPNQNLTHITFLVPPGVYNYTLSGGAPMGGELYTGSGMTSGTVVVNGADVSVSVEVWLSFTCTSTTTSTA